MHDRGRESVIVRVEGRVVAGLVLIASLIFVPLFPDGTLAKWQVLYVLAALSAVRLMWSRFDTFDFAVIAFVLYAISTYLWAVDPFGVVHAAPRWIAMGLIIMGARRIRYWAPIHWMIGVSVLAIVAMSAIPYYPSVIGNGDLASGFMNENYATSYMVTALPMLFALVAGWPLFFLSAIICTLTYIVFINGAKLEVAAITAWTAIWVAPRIANPKVWMLVGLIAIFVMWYALTVQSASINYRLLTWERGWEMFLAAPLLGHGLGGLDALYSTFAGGHDPMTPRHGAFAVGAAHNDWLQLVTDTGIAGMALAALLVVMVIRTPNKPSWAVYGLAGLSAIAFLDFPLQQPGPCLLGALCLGAAVRAKRVPRQFPLPWLALRATPVAAIALVLAVAGVRNVSAELHFRDVIDTHKTQPLASYVHVREAIRDWPFSKWYRREAYLRAAKAGVVGVHLDAARGAMRSAYPWHPTVERIDRLVAMRRHQAGGIYD